MPTDQTPSDPRTDWQRQPTEDFRMSHALLDRYVSTSHRRLRWLTAAQYAGTSAGLVGSIVVASVFDGRMMRIGAVLMAILFAFVFMLLYRAPRGRDVCSAIAEPSIESYRADLFPHPCFTRAQRLARPRAG